MRAVNLPLLTLEETLASQKDLATLCADRPLKTKEIFQPNAFYGNDFVLKKYADMPQTYCLKLVIPHGTSTSEDYVWEAEVKAPLPAILCYSSHREAANRRTNKYIVYSTYPFVYVVEMLSSQPKPERRGTMFFPTHSTHHVTAQMDFEAMAEELKQLDEQYQPVTVCVYWRDFNLGHHLPFQERGLSIVSAGHMHDPAFLFRFYHLCSVHRYSSSNLVGSSLFYSVKSGCSYFYLDVGKPSHVAEADILRRDTSSPSPSREAALKSLFGTPQPCTTAEQMKAVDYYLGAGYLESPQGVRRQLLYAERLDKFGFFVHNRGRRGRFVIPSYYRRIGMNVAIRLKLADAGSRVRRLWRRTGKRNDIC